MGFKGNNWGQYEKGVYFSSQEAHMKYVSTEAVEVFYSVLQQKYANKIIPSLKIIGKYQISFQILPIFF